MKKGFTLMEVMVVIIICGILLLFFSSLIFSSKSGNGASWGINGLTETRCIDGYKFIIGYGGQARQIMDSYGKGVPCK
jgi:prepilin-type N-terminal cleavage/methylation domain-containing protein